MKTIKALIKSHGSGMVELYKKGDLKIKKCRLSINKKYRLARRQACEKNDSIKLISNLYDEFVAPYRDEPEIFYDAFLRDSVEEKYIKWNDDKDNSPIFICAVKNDLQRVRMQMEHYRKLGFKKFAYIDNGSTDGTFEWLSRQDDVNLYFTEAKYKAIRRVAWYRAITDIYGYDRWYFICDSDEFFVYPNCENVNIDTFITYMENKGKTSVCAIMLDMYSKGEILSDIELDDEAIMSSYAYFDVENYRQVIESGGINIKGGARERIFAKEGEGFGNLTKYPLIKLQSNDLYMAHKVYRKVASVDRNLHAVLKHYKFLPKDGEKYREIIKLGNYAGGSREYKRYMEVLKECPSLSFYYSQSEKFESSEDIFKLSIFDIDFYADWKEYKDE